MAKNSTSVRHHLVSLALTVLATFSTSTHAQSTITAGDTTYRGSFTTDAKNGAVNGSGTVQWKNGNRYEGPVVNTQLTGKGTFTWANGDTYVGDLVNAQPHGQGTYSFKSGDRYVGAWRNGQKHGMGRYTYGNGLVWEGEFENDQQFKQGAVDMATATPAFPVVASAPVTASAIADTPKAPAVPATVTEAPWVGKSWEVRRAAEDVWRTPTWVFYADGTAEAKGLWKGTWNPRPNGWIKLQFTTTDGKPVSYDIEFAPANNDMTMYRDGKAYGYGRVAVGAAPSVVTPKKSPVSASQEDPNFMALAAQFELLGDRKVPVDTEFAKYFNAALPLPDTVCSQQVFAQLARLERYASPFGNAYSDKRLGDAYYLKFLNETPQQLGLMPADVRKAFSANKRLEQENRYSLSLLTNANCDRVLVRFAKVAWLNSGKQAVEVSYADIRMKFSFTHALAKVTGRAQNQNSWFDPGADAVQAGVRGLYRIDDKSHVVVGDALFYENRTLEKAFQEYPDKIRSTDPWPPETKAEIAAMEKARNEQLARAEVERKAKEAREAEQARLTAIESEKRRKQEQARFDSAMNAKDPQAMYLAAGKYEREGDSYSARKVYEQIIDRFPSSPFAAKANDQLLANRRSDKARSDLFDAQRDAQRQQGEAAYKACMVQSDACYRRNNSFKGCTLPSECNSLR
jgi:hypothetical protein